MTSKIITSVVIAAKNEEKFIERCLKALKNQTRKCEIIVVDGHSSDKTRKIAKKYADKIILDNKKGISDARNVGAKNAKGQIVAYCDADSIPNKKWVENIEKFIGRKIGVYGPIVPYDGKAKTRIILNFLNKLIRLSHNVGNPCICGANMAFRKDVLTKHRFDEKMDILEDYEIGYRLIKHGKIGYYNQLAMPISSRRYEDNIVHVIIFHYIRNFYRLRMGKSIKATTYWTEIESKK